MPTKEPYNETLYAAAIENTISSFFEENIAKATTIHPQYTDLWQALNTLIRSGGKRIRPQLTLLAYNAFEGIDSESILPIAAAQELLHLSMLIHDDIIDRDYVRYGVDNIAGTYEKIYLELVANEGERKHYAQSAALIAGDLLISGAYQMILSASVIPQEIIAVQKLLGNTIFEIAGGELLDTELAFRTTRDIDAETIAYYKTASYTFIGPLMTGALLAHASESDMILLKTYAENLGIAYQFTDDILGVFGDEAITGKSSTGDIREGKKTYMVEQFYALASEKDINTFNRIFGNSAITPEEIDAIRSLLISSGAKQKIEDKIGQHVDNAKIALAALKTDNECMQGFTSYITLATKREC